MAARGRLNLHQIRSLKPGETAWDSSVVGFGARRQRGAAVAYVLTYRTREGRQRFYTLGRHGSPWTPHTAREEARRLLGEVAAGGDPAVAKRKSRKATTVAELCELYFVDAESGRLITRRGTIKKSGTLAIDRGRIDRHIRPLLGHRPVAAVTTEDIKDFMHDVAMGKTAGRIKTSKKFGLANVRGGQSTAARTVGLLGAIFHYAVDKRMRPDNPVHSVKRYADKKRDRRLSDEEYAALNRGLLKAEEIGIWPWAIGVTRFLVFTGWRSSEALGLRWAPSELDLNRRTATLGDTKTGQSIRPLSQAACAVLRSFPRSGELVFPATRGNGRMTGYSKLWARIGRLADLPEDVTPHVLRHSFASLAGDLGFSEPTIAALIGHKGRTVTSRYVHSADAVLLAAADAVANKTLALMGESAPEAHVIPLRA
jgi:integrase